MPQNSNYSVLINDEAKSVLDGLDKIAYMRVRKRLESLAWLRPKRTLKKHPGVWVLEIGGYRALYLIDENAKTKTVFFIGDHKGYERRYMQTF